jgi:CDP-diacylglycerol--glycerol-3-phosphate 3-phosphatidyltransferase
VSRPIYLPNLLSSLRIVLAPAMLGAAYSNSKPGFVGLLVLALATDVIDGACARAWEAESRLGCRLDRWGDGLTMVLGAIGVFFLWPGAVERDWEAALAALAGYALIGLQRWRVPAASATPTRWWCRLASWAVPVSLVPWLGFDEPWAFRGAAALHLLMGLGRLVGVWTSRPGSAATGLSAAQEVAG